MSIKAELPSKVIVAVLSTLIVGVIYLVLDWIKPGAIGMLSWIWSGVVACFTWFFDRAYLPRWLHLLIAGFAIAYLYEKVMPLLRGEQGPREPTFTDFTEFDRYGLVWRWTWANSRPKNITAFCPRCDRIMRYQEDNRLFDPEPTEFFCQDCRGVRIACEGKHYETIKKVNLEIEHCVRTGSWKQHVKTEQV